jgi:imidazolonepropionase
LGDVEEVDCEGGWVLPGLVDCHTHLVFGGDRSHEFEMRLNGATYEHIARAGGGIRSTVAATRQADDATLFAASLRRLHAMLREGVTTVEVKSGYGLDLETERKMLRVARQLGAARDVTVKTTYLAAHALPPEFQGRQDDYIAACIEWMQILHSEGLVDAVDAFCENIGFTREQVELLFKAARKLDLPVKLHAEQLSWSGSTKRASPPWRPTAPWPCYCPSPSTACAKLNCHPSKHYARRVCPWRYRPTAIPARHPPLPRCWR